MLTGCFQKSKEKLHKRLTKGSKIFLKKRKTKCVNMPVKVVKLSLKKKKKKRVHIVTNTV